MIQGLKLAIFAITAFTFEGITMDALIGPLTPGAIPTGQGRINLTSMPGDSRQSGGQFMPQGTPYGMRQPSSNVIYTAAGEPYRTSGRFPMKGDDKTYVDFHNINPYTKVLHTYEASHGYADNSYLIFFPREEWYQERQKYSLRSVSAFRSVVDAMIQPVFEKEVSRTTDSDMFQGFINNSDNTGTSLQDINETAQTHARMMGLTFLVMDNFPDSRNAKTVKDAIDQRKFPYVYEKMPQDVYKWKCNNWGKLEWISFFEKQETVPDPDHPGKFIIRQYYRRWTAVKWEIYYEYHNPDKYEEYKEIITESSPHGLNYMPIYPILDYTKNNNLTNFPSPLMSDLANMAFVLYNLESWIMLLSVYQFPILTLPPMDGMQMAVSVTNAIEVPNEAKNPPAFIAPQSACLEVLLKTGDRLEDKIYKAAHQLGVSGTKAKTNQMVSGISKEWDFQASNALLTKTAFSSRKAELWMAKGFSDYIRQGFKFDVDFATEFVEAYSNQRLDQILNIQKELPPKKLSVELWKEYTKVFFADDPERSHMICDTLDLEYKQEIQDKSQIEEKGIVIGPDGKPISTKVEEPVTGEQEGADFQQAIGAMLAKFGKKKTVAV